MLPEERQVWLLRLKTKAGKPREEAEQISVMIKVEEEDFRTYPSGGDCTA